MLGTPRSLVYFSPRFGTTLTISGNSSAAVEEGHRCDFSASAFEEQGYPQNDTWRRGGACDIGACWDAVDLRGLKTTPYHRERHAVSHTVPKD
jgi:hypothetical protein